MVAPIILGLGEPSEEVGVIKELRNSRRVFCGTGESSVERQCDLGKEDLSRLNGGPCRPGTEDSEEESHEAGLKKAGRKTLRAGIGELSASCRARTEEFGEKGLHTAGIGEMRGEGPHSWDWGP